MIRGIDDKDDGIHGRVVVSPNTTSLKMPAKIEGGEADVSYGQLFGSFSHSKTKKYKKSFICTIWAVGLLLTRLPRRHVLYHYTISEHTNQSRFTGVVETNKKKLSSLILQACQMGLKEYIS